MALQTSGPISLNDIHIEAGGTTGTNCTINDTDIRNLISKASGATMSFNEWYGASGIPTPTSPSIVTVTTGATTSPYGGAAISTAFSYTQYGMTTNVPATGTAPANFFSYNAVLPGARILSVVHQPYPNYGSPQFQVYVDYAYGNVFSALPNLKVKVTGPGGSTQLIPLGSTVIAARHSTYASSTSFFNASIWSIASTGTTTGYYRANNNHLNNPNIDYLWPNLSPSAAAGDVWTLEFTW